MRSLIDMFREYLARPDVIESERPGVAVFRDFLQALSSYSGEGRAAFTLSPGYETWLADQKVDPVLARTLARLVARSGRRVARDGERYADVSRAVRFLARPRRSRPAIERRVRDLLAASAETSVIECAFFGYPDR